MAFRHNLKGTCGTDYGPEPFVGNIAAAARQNQNFRIAYWTGQHLQMTLMHIPVCGDIGVEMHPNTDQHIRVESGQALVRMGECRENLCESQHISSLRIKKQGEVKNFCRSHPAGPRRIGLAQSSGKSTLPTKE